MAISERRPGRCLGAFALDWAVVVLEIWGFVLAFGSFGAETMIYYTQDSNLFLCLACLAAAVARLPVLTGRKERIPKWVFVVKYIGVCLTAVTFLVVIFVLAPMYGGDGDAYKLMLLSDSMLFHHALCPVLALLSFLLFEKEETVTFRHSLLALIPTLIYAAVLIPLNILRLFEGPYPFLMVYKQPWYMSVMWCVLILGGAFLIAIGVKALSGVGRKK